MWYVLGKPAMNCVEVCAQVCVNVCCWIAKFLKTDHKYGTNHRQSNGVGQSFFLLVIDFHFQGQTFSIYLICEYLINGDRLDTHYCCYLLGSPIFAVEWRAQRML